MIRKKIVLAVLVVILYTATSVYASSGTRLRMFYNFSEPRILDVDTVSSFGVSASSISILGTDSMSACEEAEQSQQCVNQRFIGVIPLIFLNSSLNTTVHEYGHFRAFSRLGLTDFVMRNKATGEEVSATPLTVFLLSLRANSQGDSIGEEYAASVSQQNWNEMWENEAWRNAFLEHRRESVILLESGGLNQVQHAAEMLSEDVRDGVAHPLDWVSYFSYIMSTVMYSKVQGGDTRDYIEAFSNSDASTSFSEVQVKSQWPKLLSGSTLALARGAMSYLKNGTHEVKPLTFNAGGFRFFWPEFASYLTLYGPTVKASEYIRLGNGGKVVVAAEQSLATGMREFTIGSGYGNLISLYGKVTRNMETSGSWFELDAAYKWARGSSLGLRGYHGTGYTFAREIVGKMPSFLKDTERGVKLFVQLTF